LLESQLFGHELAHSQVRNKASRENLSWPTVARFFGRNLGDESTCPGKNLGVLEYGEFCSASVLNEAQRLNARIICASNCSLRERVRQGKFREDLYQRLNGLTLLIPPAPGKAGGAAVLIAQS